MQHKGTTTIQTERLLLRQFRLDDAEDIYQNYGSDSKVHKFISWITCDTREKVQQFLNMHLKKYDDDLEFYGWAIVLNSEVIGSIGLYNVNNDNQSTEIGYSLGSKWWGQGLVTEAAHAVVDYAFDIGFHRVFATCHEDNIGSKRVLEKIGMNYEGKLIDGQKNRDNTFSNLDMYAIVNK